MTRFVFACALVLGSWWNEWMLLFDGRHCLSFAGIARE
jgi:hypothetical protein